MVVLIAAMVVSRVMVASRRRAEPGLDPASREWMDGLESPAGKRQAVQARLHGLLLHVARREVARRNGWLPHSGPDLDDLARQAAADALTAITAQLDGFRGQSRFSSWASKFVLFSVSAVAGRHLWRPVSLDQEDWDRLPSSIQPHEHAEPNELISTLRRAVDEDLSGDQRAVFTAVTLHGAPTAALAAALESSRNTIYKALFEARRILRARLAANDTDFAHLPEAPLNGLPWLDDLLPADPGDAGCDITFHVLDRYAEAELNGTVPASRFPGVAAHLGCCESCGQDYQGLLGAIEGLRVREATDVRTQGCLRRLRPRPPALPGDAKDHLQRVGNAGVSRAGRQARGGAYDDDG